MKTKETYYIIERLIAEMGVEARDQKTEEMFDMWASGGLAYKTIHSEEVYKEAVLENPEQLWERVPNIHKSHFLHTIYKRLRKLQNQFPKDTFRIVRETVETETVHITADEINEKAKNKDTNPITDWKA